MSNFDKLLGEDEIVVPDMKNISTVNSDGAKKEEDSKVTAGDSKSEGDDPKKTKKSKKASGNVDEVLNSLMNKKETARLGLTINKEIYDKLKTLSMTSSKSVTKVVSELLTASLAKVEIDYDLVEAFDENFKEKRKK